MLFEDGYSFRFQKRNVIYMISLHDESWEIYYFSRVCTKARRFERAEIFLKELCYFSKHTIFQQVAPKMLHQGLFFLLFLNIYKQFWSKQKKNLSKRKSLRILYVCGVKRLEI